MTSFPAGFKSELRMGIAVTMYNGLKINDFSPQNPMGLIYNGYFPFPLVASRLGMFYSLIHLQGWRSSRLQRVKSPALFGGEGGPSTEQYYRAAPVKGAAASFDRVTPTFRTLSPLLLFSSSAFLLQIDPYSFQFGSNPLKPNGFLFLYAMTSLPRAVLLKNNRLFHSM